MKKFYEEFEIHRYSTNSPLKCTVIENKVREVEYLMYRKMTADNSNTWYTWIQSVAVHLNQKKRKKLYGLSANECYEEKNVEFLRRKYLEDYKAYAAKHRKPIPLQPGDTVRVVVPKTKLTPRGYEHQWGSKLWEVEKILLTNPRSIKLKGNRRKFYLDEVIKARHPLSEREKSYFISKTRVVNAKRLRNGKTLAGDTQYLLRSRNDPSIGSWLSSSQYRRMIQDGLVKPL